MKTAKAPLILGCAALLVEYVAIISTNQASLTMAAQAGGYDRTSYALLAKVLAVVGVLISGAALILAKKTQRPGLVTAGILFVLLSGVGAGFAWSISSRAL